MANKKEIILDENGAAPCKHCRRRKNKRLVYPVIKEDHGLFYARCPICCGEDKYDYLGLSKSKAISVWNKTMMNKGALPEEED